MTNNPDNSFSLGSAHASVVIDASSVHSAVQQAQSIFSAGLGVIGGGLRALGDQIGSVGRSLTVLNAPLTAFYGTGLRVAASFEEVMTQIKVFGGVSSAELEKVRQFVLKMGADTVFSAQDAGDAMLDLLKSGQTLEQAMKTLPVVLQLATVGNLSLATASGVVTSAMAQFGLKAEDAGRITNALAQAASASRADVSDLGQALANVGPIARTYGLSIEDTSAVLAIFANNGIMGAEAGTQLKSMLLNLSRPTDKVQAAMKKLGVSLYDATGNTRDFNTFIKDLDGALDKLPIEEQNTLMYELAGSYGITGLNALRAAGGIDDMSTAMQKAPVAAEVTNASVGTMNRLFESLKGSIETLQVEAITPLMENNLKPLVQRAIEVVNAITAWIGANPELASQIVMIGAGLAVLGPVLVVVGAVLGAIGTVIGAILSPIGLLIGLVAALGVAWSTNFLGIRDITAQVFAAVVQFVQTTVIPGIQQLFIFLATAWANIQPYLNELWVWFTQTALPAVVNFVQTTVMPIINDLVSVLQTIWQIVGPPLGELFNWFTGPGLPVIKNIVEQFWHVVLEPLINTMAGMWNAVRDSLHQFAQWFHDNIDPIRQFVQGLVRDLENLINMASRALDSLRGIQNNATVIQQGLNSGQFNLGDVFKATVGAIGQEFGHHANAGTLSSGWNVLGEGGAELVYARGGEQSYTAAQSQHMMSTEQQPLVGQVVIYANSKAEGAAAAEGFAERLEELHRRRG